MAKLIDLSRSVFDLAKEYPEIVAIMKELGFDSITDPKMISTAGRFMTIPKGAAMKGIPLETIKEKFNEKGFQVKGQED